MSRYKVISQPAKWVSAHRKNEYKVRLPQSIISSGFNSGGYLKLILSSAFPFDINVGDRVYIALGSTDYTGFHTIKSIDSSIQFTLETSYVSNIGGQVIWQVVLPTVSIYRGYADNELLLSWDGGTLDMYDVLPRTLTAQFQPEAGADGYLTFDICGYLKTVIDTPYKGAYSPDETNYLYEQSILGIPLAWYTPKYYNKVEVFIDETLVRTHYVANASITTDELNREFVDTGRMLHVLKRPVKLFGQYELGDFIDNNILKAKINY